MIDRLIDALTACSNSRPMLPLLPPHQKGREIVNVNHVYIRNDTVARPHGHSTIFRCTQSLRTVGYYSALVSVGHRSNGNPKCIVVLLLLYIRTNPSSFYNFVPHNLYTRLLRLRFVEWNFNSQHNPQIHRHRTIPYRVDTKKLLLLE